MEIYWNWIVNAVSYSLRQIYIFNYCYIIHYYSVINHDTVQLNINFTHACREHVYVCTLMACNFVNYGEYFNFARFGSVHSRATVHDNTLEYTLHE